MKRIIAFVLLGLCVYAGGFVIYYSYLDLKLNTAVPTDIDNIPEGGYYSGMVVSGSIYQVIGKEMFTESVRTNSFGRETMRHYFNLPIGAQQRYMMIAATNKDDLEAIKKLCIPEPRERAEGDPSLNFIGVVGEMPPQRISSFSQHLCNYPNLIGYDIGSGLEGITFINEAAAKNRIVPFIIYIQHPKGVNYIPLIVGIVMCVGSVTAVILLIRRIKDEKEGY